MFQFCCQQMTDLNRKPYTIQMIQSDITLGKEEGSGEISQSDSFSADIFYTKNLIHKLTMPSAESWSVFQVCPENPSEPLGVWRSSEVKSLNHVRLFATPWAVAYQAPLSMGFTRQQYWSGLPFSSPLQAKAFAFSMIFQNNLINFFFKKRTFGFLWGLKESQFGKNRHLHNTESSDHGG